MLKPDTGPRHSLFVSGRPVTGPWGSGFLPVSDPATTAMAMSKRAALSQRMPGTPSGRLRYTQSTSEADHDGKFHRERR